MRGKAPLLAGLLAVALAGLTGCVASPGSLSASAPASPALYDPCAIPSGDYPPGKLEAMKQICHQTLPPVTGTPVPWLDAPYTGPRATPTETIDVKAAYSTCSATDLEVAFAGWGSSSMPEDAGTYGWIVARTKGSVTCLLDGEPQVRLLDGSGQVLATGSGGDGPMSPAVLLPGLAPQPSTPPSDGPLGPELIPGYAYSEIRVVGYCDPTQAPAALEAALPNSAHVRFAIPALPALSCTVMPGIHVTQWWFRSVDQPQPKVLPPSWLQPIVSLPDEAVVGQTMHFTVALQNGLSVPVALEPCPAYTIGIATLTPFGKGGPQVVREYALNCGSVKTIPPHSAVSFDMEFDVPADAPLTDQLWFNWSLGPKEQVNVGVLTHPVRLVAAES
jgi:hypothetical protein